MTSTRACGPIGTSPPLAPICAASTPGPLGVRDRADPNAIALAGDTPGAAGLIDAGQPAMCIAPEAPGHTAAAAEPLSGSIPVGIGVSGVVRFPVPGSGGLFVELRPRGHVPASGSTSTLFIQDATGKKHLRLDYGPNKVTGRIDYHWNQKGTHASFGITDHTPAGGNGKTLHRAAKALRYGGRVLLVVGVAADAYSIVVAEKRWRQVARVAAGWGGAVAGCKVIGAGGAVLGTAVEPGGGTAVGGLLGCMAGGVGGYWGLSWAAGEAYDWVEETVFVPLVEEPGPAPESPSAPESTPPAPKSTPPAIDGVLP